MTWPEAVNVQSAMIPELPWRSADRDLCYDLAMGMRSGQRYAFVCTRPKDHGLRHAAADNGLILAVWPNLQEGIK